MSDKKRIVGFFVLAGLALLIMASPIANWIGHFFSHETPESVPKMAKAAGPLPTLRLKRDPVKSSTPSEPVESKLTAPVHHLENTKTLENEEIDSMLQQRQPQFMRCWTQRLKDMPSLAGKMDLQFEINPRGRVQDVHVVDSNIEDEAMSRCIVSVLERIQFREFRGGAITLTFPMQFE